MSHDHSVGHDATRLGLPVLALAAAAMAAVAATSAATASPAATSWRPAQLTATPTTPPPAGTWSVVHAANHDPLWPTNPPNLRGVDGRVGADGIWRGAAVGEEGAVVLFNGADWTALHLQADPLTYAFQDVAYLAPDNIWVVGHVSGDRNCSLCGVMVHYDGNTWRRLDPNEYGVISKPAPLNAIDMLQGADGKWYGWAVGDDADFDNIKAIILHYVDGDWTLWTGTNNIAKNLYDVKLVGPDEAWAVGEGGSESWYRLENGVGGWPRLGHSGVDTLYAVDLADQLFGWDGGVAGRMNHYHGTCHDDTTATQCWFDNQARPIRDGTHPVTNDVYDIDLLGRASGWLVGEAVSRQTLIAYYEGESSWRPVSLAGDPGESLFALKMVNAGRGFAVGDAGVILEYVDETYAPTPTPTEGVTPSATVEPSASPTASPSAEPTTPTPATETPTATPGTAEPTATEVPPSPTEPEPTSTPTQLPTDTPTATPITPAPTATTPRGTYTIYAPLVLTHRPLGLLSVRD